MKTLNLQILARLLASPWAIRKETLASYTQAVLAGGQIQPAQLGASAGNSQPRTDTSWNVLQWDREKDDVVRKPLATKAGYTMFNVEGVMADRRGTLPDAPEGVTVLLVWGPVGRAWGAMDQWWFDAIEVDEIVAQLSAVPEGSTVVLWFRSPGGIVTGIPETAAEIRRLKKARTLRLIGFSDDLCASAAYWIAAMCDLIVATPTAEMGSIGVYLAYYDFCAYLEKMGVKLELFRAGDKKGIGLMGYPLDDAARQHLQAGVLEAYRMFTRDVTNQRAIADEHMQGQTLNGKAAIAATFVDAWQSSAAAFFDALGRGKI